MEEIVVASAEMERLREVLDELHGALESAESVDPALQEPLRDAIDEIREILDVSTGESKDEAHRQALSSRVEEMALHFEADHPTIAGTLNRLTHMLSSMGI